MKIPATHIAFFVLALALTLPSYGVPKSVSCLAVTRQADLPASGKFMVFNPDTRLKDTAIHFDAVKRQGRSYIHFITEASISNPEIPRQVFVGDGIYKTTTPVFQLTGIKVEKNGNQFSWYIPTLETKNFLIGESFAEKGLEQTLWVTGHPHDVTSSEEYGRNFSNGLLTVDVKVFDDASHDLIDHLPWFVLLATHQPDLWKRSLKLLSKGYGLIDRYVPAAKGYLTQFGEYGLLLQNGNETIFSEKHYPALVSDIKAVPQEQIMIIFQINQFVGKIHGVFEAMPGRETTIEQFISDDHRHLQNLLDGLEQEIKKLEATE